MPKITKKAVSQEEIIETLLTGRGISKDSKQ